MMKRQQYQLLQRDHFTKEINKQVELRNLREVAFSEEKSFQ
jgi:hypothetical protein